MKFLNKVGLIAFLFVLKINYAQEKAFYINMRSSFQLIDVVSQFQQINFKSADVVFNNIINFDNETFRIIEEGKYQINGFININPGTFGKTEDDKIDISVYLLKNFLNSSQQILAVERFVYTLGNLDVSNSYNFLIDNVNLNPDDELYLLVKIFPS